MNGPRYRQEKKIFKMNYNKIHSNCIKDFCMFLQDYMTAFEDDNSLMRSCFLVDDIFNGLEEIIMQNSLIYEKIMEKVYFYIANYKTFKNSKYISTIIGYAGMIFEFGLFGTTSDKTQAFKYYCLSAQLNSPYGTYKVACCFEKGIGTKKNIEKAISFYRCSAKLGSIQGLHIFGTILLQSNRIPDKYRDSGLFYLGLGIKKANLSYPYICYDYGKFLEAECRNSKNSVEIDYCFKVYSKGAQNDCSNCQYRLAECYEKGELNIQVNMHKAFEYYKKSAFNGNVDAQLRIVQAILSEDRLSNVDINLAFKYALKAATKENCIAIKYISLFYKNGLGTKRNLRVSEWWEKILEVSLRKQKIQLDSSMFVKVEKMIIIEKTFVEVHNSTIKKPECVKAK